MSFNYTADGADVDTLNLAETMFPADGTGASSFSFELGEEHTYSDSFGGVPLQQQELWEDGQLTLSNTSRLFYTAHSSAENSANNSLSIHHSQTPLQQHQLSHPHLPQHLQPHSRSSSHHSNHHLHQQQHPNGHQFLGSPLKFQQQDDGSDNDQVLQGRQSNATLNVPSNPPEITLSSDNDPEDEQRLLFLSNIGSGKKGDSISLFAKLGDESDLSYDLFKEELDADETKDASRFIFDQSMIDPASGNVSSLGPAVRHGMGGGVESLFDQQFPANISGNHSLTEDQSPLSLSQHGQSTPLLSTGADLDYEEIDKDFLSMLRSKTTTQQSTPIAALAPPPSLMVTSPTSERLDSLSSPILGSGLDGRPPLSEAAMRILEEKARSRPKTKVNEEYQAALKSFKDSLRIADPVRTPHKFGPQPLPILWNAPKLRTRVLPDLNLTGTGKLPLSLQAQPPSTQSTTSRSPRQEAKSIGQTLAKSASNNSGVGSPKRMSEQGRATPPAAAAVAEVTVATAPPHGQQPGKDMPTTTASSSMTSASSVSPRQKLDSRPMSPSTSLSSDALDDVAPIDLADDVKLLSTSPSIGATSSSSPNQPRHWMKTPLSPDTPISTPGDNDGSANNKTKEAEPDQAGTTLGMQDRIRSLTSGVGSPKAGAESHSRGLSTTSSIGGANTVAGQAASEAPRPQVTQLAAPQKRGSIRPDAFQEPPARQQSPRPREEPAQEQGEKRENGGEKTESVRPRSTNILPESLTSVNNYPGFHSKTPSTTTAKPREPPTERAVVDEQPQGQDAPASPLAASRRKHYSASGDTIEPANPVVASPSMGGRTLAGTIPSRYSRSGSSGSRTEAGAPPLDPVNSNTQGSLAGRVRTSQLQEPQSRRTTHHRQSIIDGNIFMPPSSADTQEEPYQEHDDGYQDMEHPQQQQQQQHPPSRPSRLLEQTRPRQLSSPSSYSGHRLSQQDVQQSPTYGRQRYDTDERLSDMYPSPTEQQQYQQYESDGQYGRPQPSQPAATLSRYQSRLSRPSSLVRRVSDEGGYDDGQQDYHHDEYGQQVQQHQAPINSRLSKLSPPSRRRPLTTSGLPSTIGVAAGGIMNGYNAYQARRQASISSQGGLYDGGDGYGSGVESGLPTPTTPRKASLTRGLDGELGGSGSGYRSYAGAGGHVRTASGSSATGIRRPLSNTVSAATGSRLASAIGGGSGVGLSHQRTQSLAYDQPEAEEEEYARVFVPPQRSATIGQASGQSLLQSRTPLAPIRKSSLNYAHEGHDRIGTSGGTGVGGVGYMPASPTSGMKRYSTISGATGRHSIASRSNSFQPQAPGQQEYYYEDEMGPTSPYQQPASASVRRSLTTMGPSSGATMLSGIPGSRRPSSSTSSLKRASGMDLPGGGGPGGIPRPNMPPLRTASGSSASSSTSLNSPLSAGAGGGVGHRPSTLSHYQQSSTMSPTRLQQPMATALGGVSTRRSMLPSIGGAGIRSDYYNSPSRRSSGSSMVYGAGAGTGSRRGSNNSTTAEVNAYGGGHHYYQQDEPIGAVGGGGYRHSQIDYDMHSVPEPVAAGGRRLYRTSYR